MAQSKGAEFISDWNMLLCCCCCSENYSAEKTTTGLNVFVIYLLGYKII